MYTHVRIYAAKESGEEQRFNPMPARVCAIAHTAIKRERDERRVGILTHRTPGTCQPRSERQSCHKHADDQSETNYRYIAAEEMNRHFESFEERRAYFLQLVTSLSDRFVEKEKGERE